MEIHAIYLQVHPEDIGYIQALFESYEGVGIVRTVDRSKAVVVLLVADDFMDTARSILSSLKNETPVTEIPKPAGVGDDWLLRELTTESSSDE